MAVTLEPGYHDLEEGDVVKYVNILDAEIPGSVVREGGELLVLWADGIWAYADEWTRYSKDEGYPYTVERAA